MIDLSELKKFKIFKELNDRELELVANIGNEEICDAGLRIFEEKSLAVNLYLVVKGKIAIKISGFGGAQVQIDEIVPGEIFGWSAIVDPNTFTAAAHTLDKSKLIVLSGERLRGLFEMNNHIGYRVLKEIGKVVSRRLKAVESKFGS